MKNLTVGNFKSTFSEVLKEVESGQEIIISYGKNKKKVAVIIPFEKYDQKPIRTLGLLKNSKIEFKPDFKITDEEFLNS